MSNTERLDGRPEKTRPPKKSAAGDRHSARPKVLARLPDLDLKELDRVVETTPANKPNLAVRRKWQRRTAAAVLLCGASVLAVAYFFPSQSTNSTSAPGDAAVYQPDESVAKTHRKNDTTPRDAAKVPAVIVKAVESKPVTPIMLPALPPPAVTKEASPAPRSSSLPTATIPMPAVSSGTQLIPMPTLSESGLPAPPAEPGPASGTAQLAAVAQPAVEPAVPAPAAAPAPPIAPMQPVQPAPVQAAPQVVSSPFTAEYEAIRRENLATGPFVQPPLTSSPLVNPVAMAPAVAQPTSAQPTITQPAMSQPAVPVMAAAPSAPVMQPALPVQTAMAPTIATIAPAVAATMPVVQAQAPGLPVAAQALPTAMQAPVAQPPVAGQPPLVEQPAPAVQPLPVQPYPPAASNSVPGNGYPNTGYQAALPAMQTAGPGGLPMVAPNGIRLDGINNNSRSAQRANYGDARSSLR